MEKSKKQNQIRGSLIGGAAGDALGYAVEFWNEDQIFSRYGSGGIRSYTLDRASGKALISDDTQMTLFTANGLLFAETRVAMRGIGGQPRAYMLLAYQDWLRKQRQSSKCRKEPASIGKTYPGCWKCRNCIIGAHRATLAFLRFPSGGMRTAMITLPTR